MAPRRVRLYQVIAEAGGRAALVGRPVGEVTGKLFDAHDRVFWLLVKRNNDVTGLGASTLRRAATELSTCRR